MIFNNTQKLLAGTLALVLVAGLGTPAYASLIGDTMHVKVSNLSINAVLCDDDIVVVDPGVEVPDCAGTVIDVNGDSIWFTSFLLEDGFTAPELLFEFTSMDWTNNPSGKIIGVELFDTTPVPMLDLTFTDNSITLHNDEFLVVCGGPPECIVEFHIDIETFHPVAGELLPLDSTALFLAGIQSMTVWMVPTILGLAGAGVYLVKFRKQ